MKSIRKTWRRLFCRSKRESVISVESPTLEEMARNMQQTVMYGIPIIPQWEKQGDNFRQFSLYDHSKYKTRVTNRLEQL